MNLWIKILFSFYRFNFYGIACYKTAFFSKLLVVLVHSLFFMNMTQHNLIFPPNAVNTIARCFHLVEFFQGFISPFFLSFYFYFQRILFLYLFFVKMQTQIFVQTYNLTNNNLCICSRDQDSILWYEGILTGNPYDPPKLPLKIIPHLWTSVSKQI